MKNPKISDCCYDNLGVSEGAFYKARIDRETGELQIGKAVTCEIDLIICGTCGAVYDEDDFE